MLQNKSHLLGLLLALSVGCASPGTTKPDSKPTDPSTVVGENATPTQVDHFEEGVKTLSKGGSAEELEVAYEHFRSATLDDPSSVPAHFNTALSAYKLGHLDESSLEYNKVLKLDPAYKAAVYNLAAVEVERGNPQNAIAIYEGYLKKNPSDLAALGNLAVLTNAAGDHEKAIELSRQVLLQDPKNLDAYKNLSRVYFDMENYKLSQLLASNALAINDKDSGIYNDIGVTHLKLGHEPAAIAAFNKALELDQGNISANLNLGQIALKSGDFYLGFDCFDRVLAIQPGHAEAALGKAISLRGQQDFEAAIEQYKSILKLDPNNKDAQWNLALLYHEFLEDYDSALNIYQDYAKLVTVGSEQHKNALLRIESAQAEQVAVAETKRLEEARQQEEAAALKAFDEAKAPLLAKIDEAEKLVTGFEEKASAESMDALTMALEQAKAVLEYEDIDLMVEIFDYLNTTVEEFKTQNPS